MGGRGEVGCCSVPNVSAPYLRTLSPTSSPGFGGMEWGEVGWGEMGWGEVEWLGAILAVTEGRLPAFYTLPNNLQPFS